MSKEGLQKLIQQEQADSSRQGNCFSTEELRDLFTFHDNVSSEIHAKMNCIRCQKRCDELNITEQNKDKLETMQLDHEASDVGGFAEIAGCLSKLKSSEKQVGAPMEEDLASWGHHFHPESVPDTMLQASAGNEVSFVFVNQVDGKLVPVESKPIQKIQEHAANECQSSIKRSLGTKPNMSSLYRKSLNSDSSNRNNVEPSSFTKKEPISLVRASLTNTGSGTTKPKLQFGTNILPQKRHSPDEVDDHFH